MGVRNRCTAFLMSSLVLYVVGCSGGNRATQPPTTSAFESSVEGSTLSAGETRRMSEGDLCRALGEHSKVMVEDIPTGVALVLTPRDDARIEQVREGATSLRSALTGSNDVTLEHSTGEARCGIAALAGDGATVAVEQTEDTVRVHLTTLPGQVDKLRRDVRQLADALE